MKFTNVPNKPYNTEDGIIWKSRSVSVNGLIFIYFNDVKYPYVLLTKRSKTMVDEAGKWCIPCGYIDYNETISEGTIREVYEETGFEINLLDKNIFRYIPNFDINDKPNTKLQNITFTTLICYKNLPNFPKLLDKTTESDANQWINISDLNTYEIAFNHSELINKAYNYRW